MKKPLQAAAFLWLLSMFGPLLSTAFAQGTAFTYQGRLNNNGSAASGLYDFQFALSNAPSGGSQIGSTVTTLNVPVTNGLFTTTVDFGAVLGGQPAWLAISVRTNGAGTYAGLAPLQSLTPAPYAVFANTASNLSGVLPAAQISGTVSSANLLGTYGNALTLSNVGNSFNGAFSGKGDGLTNLSVNGANVVSVGNGNSGSQGNFYLGAAGDAVGLGNFNVGVGNGVLSFNGNGSGNTALGHTALGNNNGSENTAVGLDVLNSDLTGNRNTAVGSQALDQNIAGSLNIALGYQAGINIFGDSNIDIGNQGVNGDNNIIRIGSGQTSAFIAGVMNGNGGGLTNLNVTGSQVTSVGNVGGAIGNFFVGPSGNATPGGSFNLAIGDSALNFLSGGSDNIAIGNTVLENNSGGSDNTAMGLGALSANSSGSDNTAIGFHTLYNSETGSRNLALGSEAGFNLGNGSFNIDIGNQGQGGDDHVIRIGDVQTSTFIAGVINGNGSGLTGLNGANVSGVALLNSANAFSAASNSFSGKVGIGTTTPTSTLAVNGNIFMGTQRNNNVFTQVGDTIYLGAEQKYLGNTLKTALGGSTDWINLMANGISAGILFGTSGPSTADPHTGATALMVIKPSGLVGIGTASPAKKLDVTGAAGSVAAGGSVESSIIMRLNNTNSDGTTSSPDYVGIGFGQNSTRQAIVGGTFGNDVLDFYTGGTLTAPKMRIDFNGRVGIGTGTANLTHALDMGSGAFCSAAGAWTSVSDRNVKEKFTAISPADVLSRVAAMPITEWKYKVEPNGTEHIGPMAQDFHAAFGLNGDDDKHIASVDESGVALAAIQGLNEKLNEKDAEIQTLKTKNDSLAERLNNLEAAMRQLAAIK